MSVLIKGAKMPLSCYYCPFLEFFSITCKANKEADMDRDYDKKRAEGCPLVELPEKHGRLIDADAMCNDLATVDPKYEFMYDWCIRVTEAQPTVIEAEDGT